MRFLFYILISAFIFGCQKEVKIDLNNKNPKLPVFSGWVSTSQGDQSIGVETTKNFSSESTPNYLQNAKITVKNNDNQWDYYFQNDKYLPNSNFYLQKGFCKVSIEIEGKVYEHSSEVKDPLEMTDIFAYGQGDTVGLLLQFVPPVENTYSILFELQADSTGLGNNFKSITPHVNQMELINRHLNEYNVFGDILLFDKKIIVQNNSNSIIYRLISHRITDEQYNYILRVQQDNDGLLYSPQPSNLPSIFSNNGLGIVLISADSYFDFSF